MQEKEQDSSLFSLQLKKKNIAIIALLCPLQKKDFCKKHHLKDLITVNMFRDFFF